MHGTRAGRNAPAVNQGEAREKSGSQRRAARIGRRPGEQAVRRVIEEVWEQIMAGHNRAHRQVEWRQSDAATVRQAERTVVTDASVAWARMVASQLAWHRCHGLDAIHGADFHHR